MIGSLDFFSINQMKPCVTTPRRVSTDTRIALFMYYARFVALCNKTKETFLIDYASD